MADKIEVTKTVKTVDTHIVETTSTVETTSMLDAVEHKRIISDMEHVLTTANLPEKYLHESMIPHCHSTEVNWVRNFRAFRKTHAGLIIIGGDDPETRCHAICGALIRNFIDARIITLNTVIENMDTGDIPNPTVLIMPNLFVEMHGKGLTSWQTQGMYDVFLARYSSRRPSIMYVQSMEKLEKAYGSVFAGHLNTHYCFSL
jgi:hypothetical protein